MCVLRLWGIALLAFLSVALADIATDWNAVADPNWVPLGAPGAGTVTDFTPQFPACVSGHATFGDATFRSLGHFYGTDDVSFTLTSDELPEGRALGGHIADWIYANHFTAVPEPTSLLLAALGVASWALGNRGARRLTSHALTS